MSAGAVTVSTVLHPAGTAEICCTSAVRPWAGRDARRWMAVEAEIGRRGRNEEHEP
jgi:hypothetical protein